MWARSRGCVKLAVTRGEEEGRGTCVAHEAHRWTRSVDTDWQKVAADLKSSKVGQTFLNWRVWRLEMEPAGAHADELDWEGAIVFTECWPLLCVVVCFFFPPAVTPELSALFTFVMFCLTRGRCNVLSWHSFHFHCKTVWLSFQLHLHMEHHKARYTDSTHGGVLQFCRMVFWTGYPIWRTSKIRTDCSR